MAVATKAGRTSPFRPTADRPNSLAADNDARIPIGRTIVSTPCRSQGEPSEKKSPDQCGTTARGSEDSLASVSARQYKDRGNGVPRQNDSLGSNEASRLGR